MGQLADAAAARLPRAEYQNGKRVGLIVAVQSLVLFVPLLRLN